MKRWIRALCGGLVLCLGLSVCDFAGECETIRSQMLRLHILANSDSEEDQALKLQVRDAVVEAAAGMLDGSENAQEAADLAEAQLERLRTVAEETVRRAGYDYPVTAERCRMYFTAREYGAVTLPAGEYEAIRFVIGSGEGHNWWCVLFPPLCVSAATEHKTAADVLTDTQEDIVTSPQRYTVRLKVVEWWEELCRRLAS